MVSYGVSATGGSGTPTGDVTVTDGSHSCTGTVAAGQCSITFTSAGSTSLTATYAGDATYDASPASALVTHQVNRVDSTTQITSDAPEPSTIGQSVRVAFAVAATTPGAGTPTGDVIVSDGVDSCTATVAAGGCDISLTTAGERMLAARYDGDSNFNASASATEVHTVDRIATTSTITSDGPDPSVAGQAVTVHFAVSPMAGSGTPTGEVTVSDGAQSCTATVAAGRCTIALTSAGTRTLTAAYAGDGTFRASNSAGASHTVQRPAGSGVQGPTTGPPGLPPAVGPASPPPAQVSGAGQTNPRFRISAKRQLVQVSRRRAPVGTTFTYTLDTAATVRFDFVQPGRGRKAGSRCVSPNRRNKRKPRCTLRRGSLTFAGHAGLNTVRFSGWLSRTKKLAPGRYELRITAITPGVGATAQRLRFTVVR
jgi:hypothetical protein